MHNIKHTEETKRKISQAKKLNPTRYWLGKKRPAMQGERNCNWTGGETGCVDCGKKNYRSSTRCAGCNNKFRVGKNSPNWKGGITPASLKERIVFRSKLQKLIFERDNYSCTICRTKGVALQIDHIQSWSEFKELRFDPDNCRTLCMNCHYQITFNREKPKNVKTWGHNFKQIGGYQD